MKKIFSTRLAFICLLSAASVFTACQKSNSDLQAEQAEVQETAVATESDAEADVMFDDVFDNVMGVNEELGLGGNIGIFAGRPAGTAGRNERVDSAGRCFTVKISPAAAGVFPKTVTVDFGTGCTGRDGRIRRGKIISVFTGRMVEPGSKVTTTFDGHYVDSVKVEGTHMVQNTSTSNNRSFTVRVENGKLTRPSGNYVAWNGTRTRTQIEGNGTPNYPLDDVFKITGEAAGTVKRNNDTFQWTSVITEPIIRKFTCRWAVKGQVKVTKGTRTSVLDYGEGTCDNKATLTINGNTYNITLR